MTSTDKTKRNVVVLIAAKPSRPRDSLCLLLGGMHGIDIVGCADDSASALKMVSEHCPALMLLDTNLPGEEVTTVLRWIKANGSRSRCLILADNFGQRHEAKAAGADAALLKGFRTAELFQTMEELLQDE